MQPQSLTIVSQLLLRLFHHSLVIYYIFYGHAPFDHTVHISDVIIGGYLGHRLPVAISSISWLLRSTSSFHNIV